MTYRVRRIILPWSPSFKRKPERPAHVPREEQKQDGTQNRSPRNQVKDGTFEQDDPQRNIHGTRRIRVPQSSLYHLWFHQFHHAGNALMTRPIQSLLYETGRRSSHWHAATIPFSIDNRRCGTLTSGLIVAALSESGSLPSDRNAHAALLVLANPL